MIINQPYGIEACFYIGLSESPSWSLISWTGGVCGWKNHWTLDMGVISIELMWVIRGFDYDEG